MLFLLLTILANVGIFMIFRAYGIYKVNTIKAIVINYVVCVITGVAFIGDLDFVGNIGLSSPWVVIAMVLGGVFIGTFYLMARTTQVFSVTVSSIASKMSLAIPVLVSLLVLNIASKPFTWLNYLGIALAFIAIFLSSFKSGQGGHIRRGLLVLLMPVFVFLFGGLIDTTINYVNYQYLSADNEAVFPIVTFASAATVGSLLLVVTGNRPDRKSLLGGLILGVVNYFSIYFLIKTLSVFNNDGAIVYPIVNIGIILFSSLFSVLLFKEKLSLINKGGLMIAMVAIFLISYQEIIGHFQ